jgi:hypothetical protein
MFFCLISIIGQTWIHMIFTIHGFNYFWFFHKKKYKTILMIHKNDKKMYEILEQSRFA